MVAVARMEASALCHEAPGGPGRRTTTKVDAAPLSTTGSERVVTSHCFGAPRCSDLMPSPFRGQRRSRDHRARAPSHGECKRTCIGRSTAATIERLASGDRTWRARSRR